MAGIETLIHESAELSHGFVHIHNALEQRNNLKQKHYQIYIERTIMKNYK